MQRWFEMFAEKIGKNTSVKNTLGARVMSFTFGAYRCFLPFHLPNTYTFQHCLHPEVVSWQGIMLNMQPGWSNLGHLLSTLALWLSPSVCLYWPEHFTSSPSWTDSVVGDLGILFWICSSSRELQVSIRTWALLYPWYLNTSFPQQWQPVLLTHLPLHNGDNSWVFPLSSWSDLAGD